jgi:hypothetical protein
MTCRPEVKEIMPQLLRIASPEILEMLNALGYNVFNTDKCKKTINKNVL